MDYADLGKTPISDESPCGADARYEPEFEEMQSEIDKLSSPTASGQVDWDKVKKNSIVILKDKSKDLTAACYLAVSLVVKNKLEGFDQGLIILKDLIETHWEKMFPKKKRMRGRVGAVQWWLDKTELELQKINPEPLPAEMVARFKDNLGSIDGFLAQNMPDAPMMRALQRIVDHYPVQKDEAPPPEKPEDTPAAEPKPAEAAPPVQTPADKPAASAPPSAQPAATDEALSGAIGNDAEARRGADAALQRLRQVSTYLILKDAKNPIAYRYRRIAAWAKVAALPMNTDGNTQLVPPAPQVVDALNTLRDDGNLEAFVQNAEQKQSQLIFWLDLNRMVVDALKQLGAPYNKAIDAVCQETALFLQRLPNIETLNFSDGTPFADAQTKKWLKQINSGGSSGQAAASDASGGVDEDRVNTVMQQARGMARKKQVADAVSLLQQEMQHSAGYCQKMRWRLAIAQLLIESKKAQLALPHLDQIVSDIDRFQLDLWDPELAVEGLSTAWQGYSTQATNEHKTMATELLHRLAKLDPAAAVRLG